MLLNQRFGRYCFATSLNSANVFLSSKYHSSFNTQLAFFFSRQEQDEISAALADDPEATQAINDLKDLTNALPHMEKHFGKRFTVET